MTEELNDSPYNIVFGENKLNEIIDKVFNMSLNDVYLQLIRDEVRNWGSADFVLDSKLEEYKKLIEEKIKSKALNK